MGGKQSPHGNGLVDAGKGFTGKVGIELHKIATLGSKANLGHLNHGLERVFAGGGFGGQHHGVCAVQHRIGYIADLGAGGHRVGNH